VICEQTNIQSGRHGRLRRVGQTRRGATWSRIRNLPPTGGHLEQADGTAWVSLFSQNMLEIAVELAA
jgi:hypothetical protein